MCFTFKDHYGNNCNRICDCYIPFMILILMVYILLSEGSEGLYFVKEGLYFVQRPRVQGLYFVKDILLSLQ